jgi:hypothetical protein
MHTRPYLLRYSLVRLRKTLLRLRKRFARFQDRAHKRRLQRETLILIDDEARAKRWNVAFRKRF